MTEPLRIALSSFCTIFHYEQNSTASKAYKKTIPIPHQWVVHEIIAQFYDLLIHLLVMFYGIWKIN